MHLHPCCSQDSTKSGPVSKNTTLPPGERNNCTSIWPTFAMETNLRKFPVNRGCLEPPRRRRSCCHESWCLEWSSIHHSRRRFRTWKPSCSGSMLNFGGVASVCTLPETPITMENPPFWWYLRQTIDMFHCWGSLHGVYLNKNNKTGLVSAHYAFLLKKGADLDFLMHMISQAHQ